MESSQQRHRVDLELIGPPEELDELVHTLAIARRIVGQPLGTGIASVAVVDDPDVLGQLVSIEEFQDPRLVQAI